MRHFIKHSRTRGNASALEQKVEKITIETSDNQFRLPDNNKKLKETDVYIEKKRHERMKETCLVNWQDFVELAMASSNSCEHCSNRS